MVDLLFRVFYESDCAQAGSVLASGLETCSSLKSRICEASCPELTACDTWLACGGRPCREHLTVQAAGISAGSRCRLHHRLRGGGGDGGATGAESRVSYLEMYMGKKPDKVNPAEEKLARWTRCSLSGEPLSPPCCIDELGSLYNKDAVVAALLKKALPPSKAYISSLKHITDMQLCRSSSAAVHTAAHGEAVANEAEFCCPITGLPFNGSARFMVLPKNGFVISEKALKQAAATVEELAGMPVGSLSHLIPVNPGPAELAELQDRLAASRAAAKAKRALKQAKASAPAAPPAAAGALLAADPASSSLEITAKAAAELPSGAAKRAAEASQSKAAAKKFRAATIAPQLADKQVWNSIFLGDRGEAKETYSCRSLSSRGMGIS